MKLRSLGYLPVLCLSLAVLPLLGCGTETGPATDAETAVRLTPPKIEFPVSADLVLTSEPVPGGPAGLKLLLENTLPEECTVEIDLRLPRGMALEKGEPRASRRLAARGRAEMAYRVRVPGAGRHVVEARVHLPNPEGLPATGGATLVIGSAEPGKTGAEPVSVTTSDGRKLSVTVPE